MSNAPWTEAEEMDLWSSYQTFLRSTDGTVSIHEWLKVYASCKPRTAVAIKVRLDILKNRQPKAEMVKHETLFLPSKSIIPVLNPLPLQPLNIPVIKDNIGNDSETEDEAPLQIKDETPLKIKDEVGIIPEIENPSGSLDDETKKTNSWKKWKEEEDKEVLRWNDEANLKYPKMTVSDWLPKLTTLLDRTESAIRSRLGTLLKKRKDLKQQEKVTNKNKIEVIDLVQEEEENDGEINEDQKKIEEMNMLMKEACKQARKKRKRLRKQRQALQEQKFEKELGKRKKKEKKRKEKEKEKKKQKLAKESKAERKAKEKKAKKKAERIREHDKRMRLAQEKKKKKIAMKKAEAEKKLLSKTITGLKRKLIDQQKPATNDSTKKKKHSKKVQESPTAKPFLYPHTKIDLGETPSSSLTSWHLKKPVENVQSPTDSAFFIQSSKDVDKMEERKSDAMNNLPEKAVSTQVSSPKIKTEKIEEFGSPNTSYPPYVPTSTSVIKKEFLETEEAPQEQPIKKEELEEPVINRISLSTRAEDPKLSNNRFRDRQECRSLYNGSSSSRSQSRDRRSSDRQAYRSYEDSYRRSDSRCNSTRTYSYDNRYSSKSEPQPLFKVEEYRRRSERPRISAYDRESRSEFSSTHLGRKSYRSDTTVRRRMYEINPNYRR